LIEVQNVRIGIDLDELVIDFIAFSVSLVLEVDEPEEIQDGLIRGAHAPGLFELFDRLVEVAFVEKLLSAVQVDEKEPLVEWSWRVVQHRLRV
jgi:hypothetical protein